GRPPPRTPRHPQPLLVPLAAPPGPRRSPRHPGTRPHHGPGRADPRPPLRPPAPRPRRFGAPSAIGQALRTAAEVSSGEARLAYLRESVAHLERSPAAYELGSALV